MGPPHDRTREFLDRRTSIAILATVGAQSLPETCILIAAQLLDDGRVAGGEEAEISGAVFRNLRREPRATLLVLDPIMDPRARDGVRLTLEFLGAEDDGEGLERMNAWLGSFAPGRKVVRRLLFKLISSEPYRPAAEGPVLLG